MDTANKLTQAAILGVISKEDKLRKMVEINERLKTNEAQKARKLLEMAAGLSAYESMRIVRTKIAKDLDSEDEKCNKLK